MANDFVGQGATIVVGESNICISLNVLLCPICRTTQTASSYYRVECVRQCQETCSGRFCSFYLVLVLFDFSTFLAWVFIFTVLLCQNPINRNEKNQLLLGIRRAIRPQTVMPSSVLSSDSMHIGLLAAAAHAAATNSCFTIFYNPRCQL